MGNTWGNRFHRETEDSRERADATRAERRAAEGSFIGADHLEQLADLTSLEVVTCPECGKRVGHASTTPESARACPCCGFLVSGVRREG